MFRKARRKGSADASRAGLLTPSELDARRRTRRHQVRLRRAGALLVLALLVVALVLIVSGVGTGASTHSSSNARVARAPSAAPPREHPRHHPNALANDPVGAITRVLSYTPYISLGSHRRREIALTFDDGPSPYTPQILSVLERNHVPATFFEIGRSVGLYPAYTRRLARAGEVIGDHTETHPPLAALSPASQQNELREAANAITHAGAPAPHLFRPPYGSFNQDTLGLLHQDRLLMVLWSVDTSDYLRPAPAKIAYVALSGARPGAVILMHDGGGDRSHTVAALPRIIARLRERGYRLVTVPQLLHDDPPPHGQPPPTPLSGV